MFVGDADLLHKRHSSHKASVSTCMVMMLMEVNGDCVSRRSYCDANGCCAALSSV